MVLVLLITPEKLIIINRSIISLNEKIQVSFIQTIDEFQKSLWSFHFGLHAMPFPILRKGESEKRISLELHFGNILLPQVFFKCRLSLELYLPC